MDMDYLHKLEDENEKMFGLLCETLKVLDETRDQMIDEDPCFNSKSAKYQIIDELKNAIAHEFNRQQFGE